MSTAGQFSSKNPTIKRILKEASELANQPSSDYHAAPLESDLFEWHFTIRGPPSPSPFEGGLYHGRIILPPAYPLKPPSFRFLTPTGRFEVNREICLTISAHHEETWQPAWGIRTALVAIRSFMDTSASGQLGGMEASEEVRKRMAGQSGGFMCPACGRTNEEVMRECEEAAAEHGGEGKRVEEVPKELQLAYREDLGKGSSNTAQVQTTEKAPGPASAEVQPAQSTIAAQATSQTVQPLAPPPSQAQVQAQIQRPRPQQGEGIPAWIDKAIYGVIIALIILVARKLS